MTGAGQWLFLGPCKPHGWVFTFLRLTLCLTDLKARSLLWSMKYWAGLCPQGLESHNWQNGQCDLAYALVVNWAT